MSGRADGLLEHANGAGIFIAGGTQTLRNLIISNHDANDLGGGMYIFDASPTLNNVTFSTNDAFDLGGGMYMTGESAPTLTNVTFFDNDANDGGGVYANDSNPRLTNVIFNSCSADFNGGGMFTVGHTPVLINVVFISNVAGDDGGGLYNFASDDTLINVTFSGNSAGVDGGAVYNFDSFPKFVNTIMWGNVATIGPEIFNNSSTPHISYSIVEGSGGSANWDAALGTNGGGNLDADPDFVNPGVDVHLDVCSAAINTGSNAAVPSTITTDLGGNTRILFGTVDMGAYESLVPPGLRVYVKKGATGTGDGSSWTNAFPELRDALAAPLCNRVDIWVAQGTYTPTATTTRTISFVMRSGAAIYGGFAGTETLLSQRNVRTNVTILSGDIGAPLDSTDNSNHVLSATGVDTTSIVDGFTVAYGNGRQGAGIINTGGASPKLRNIIFTRNTAEDFGGAVYNAFGGVPRFTNVVITRNTSKDGGGMSNDAGTGPRLINVTFSNNVATTRGGAIDNASGSNPVLINCILWGNTAPTGPQVYNSASTPIFSYSDVQGSGGSGSWDAILGTNGGNNIDANPSFVAPTLDNVHVYPGSPVINVGRNTAVPAEVTTDLDGYARITSGTVDMGAYEFQTAPTLFATPNPLFFQTTCDTVTLINVGGSTLTINGISGCTTPPHQLDTSMTAHSLPPSGTTKFRVCIVPPAGIDTCFVTIKSNASNTPTQVMVILDVLTAIGPDGPPRPFRIVSVAPNPFNPSTTVRFSLPAPMPVTTEIWSVTGARVRTLTRDRPYAAGDNSVVWDGRNDHGSPVASGIYFIRVSTRLGTRMTRAVLLK
jgi:hypothetical protein